MNAADNARTERSVLVVEDDEPLLRFLEEALSRVGYCVFGAISAADAKGIAEHRNIDLAILDVELPDGNGVELGRTLSQEYGIPFVQITGKTDQVTLDAAVAAGAITYLVKPVELGQLHSAVETAIARADELGKLLRSVDKLSNMNDKRRSISIAVGIIMERFSLRDSEAFEILRYLARSRREQMVITAESLVDGRGGLDLLVKVSKYLARMN